MKPKLNRNQIIALILLGMMLLPLLVSCNTSKSYKSVVNVYNWGDYIDKDLLAKFEEETGIHVVYSTFNTNEDLYVKLKNGVSSYDVVMPSDYMIEKMKNEEMLRPIDWSQVPNMKYVDLEYQNHSYDPDYCQSNTL